MKKAFVTFLALLSCVIIIDNTVYANCNLTTEQFSWNNSYNDMIKEINRHYSFFNIKDKMTKEKLIQSDYAIMYILNDDTSLADYKCGNMLEFVKSNSESSFENFYYSQNGYTDYFVRYSNGESNLQNRTKANENKNCISLSNVSNKLNKYSDISGEVVFVRFTPLFLAIVSQDGTPKYVVVLDDGLYYKMNTSEDEGDGSRAIKEAFTKLYDGGNGQYVFDFSFFQDLAKARKNELPKDYIYTPKGLQAEKHNKVYKIDGRAYYFDKNGICTGLYTGYAQKGKKRVYYQNGVAVKTSRKYF